MYNVSLAVAAVEFEAFVLIGNIIQSKTAAVFSAAVRVHPAPATQLLCRRRRRPCPRSDQSGRISSFSGVSDDTSCLRSGSRKKLNISVAFI